jgi:SAM-dependent methyltransferase
MSNHKCDLSLIIYLGRESRNSNEHLHTLNRELETLGIVYEILFVNYGMGEIQDMFEERNISTIKTSSTEYGTLLREAILQSTGEYIITMELEGSTPLSCLGNLWKARGTGEIVIGSRYMYGGTARMPVFRLVTSRLSNILFSRGLDLQIRDMSSAFRLYRRQVIKNIATNCLDFDILQEILVKALMMGYQIAEIPLQYQSDDLALRQAGRFAWTYVKTFAWLWKLRNSIASADYDARAYNALMPPQRYWQRQRYKIITGLIDQNGKQKCLDVGCGSSRIIGTLPEGSLALDILIRKLRYARKFGRPVVQGSIFDLPVPDESFPCVLCSQVIEHVPRANVLEELHRALEPGGLLILGTPDYANWQWIIIEWLYKALLPQAYADEHITHYTRQELIQGFVSKRSYTLEAEKYILKGELILALRKPVK